MNFHSSRRDFIQHSALLTGGLPLGGASLLGFEPTLSPAPKAKGVIFIFCAGGLSAQESFDPKPTAPLDYRGPFASVPTTLPGVHFSSSLKQTARQAQHLCVIRSITHGEAAHERGVHNMLTGYRPSPALMYPSFGSVVGEELGGRNHLPAYVVMPEANDIHLGT